VLLESISLPQNKHNAFSANLEQCRTSLDSRVALHVPMVLLQLQVELLNVQFVSQEAR
jgi:hypothetical protein